MEGGQTAICPLATWVEGDVVGRHEKWRVDFAIEMVRRTRDTTLVLTGGKPPHGKRIHAEVLRRYVREHYSLTCSRILVSQWRASDDTFKDMLEIVRLVGIRNEFTSILIVTSWYHVPRVAMIAQLMRKNGFKVPIRVIGVWHTECILSSSFREVAATCLKTFWQASLWCKKNGAWLRAPYLELPKV